MKTTVVTVGTEPTQLVAPDDQNRYVYMQISNNSTIYVGDSTVTTANGLPLEKHSAPHEFFLPLKQTMYGVVTAEVGTASMRVMTPDTD
jgi:hypothetical protein